MGLVKIYDLVNNRTGSVHSRDLSKALDRGYQLQNASDEIKIFDRKTGRTGRVAKENLSAALKQGYSLAEADLADYGQAFTQGAGEGLGKIADTAVSAGNLINTGIGKAGAYIANRVGATDTANNLQRFANESYDYAKDYWQNPKIEQVASNALDTGLSHEKGIRVTQSAGDAVSMLPAFGGVGKSVQILTKAGGIIKLPWVRKVNKFLEIPVNNKTASSFAAMGAGSEALKSDDARTSEIENVGRELLGGLMGGAVIPYYSQKAAKSAWDNFNNGSTRASLLGLFGGKVDKDAYKALETIGVTPTPEIIAKENNLVSWLGQKKIDMADSVIKNASEKSFANIEQNLEKNLGEFIGRNETNLEAASVNASEVFNKEVSSYLNKIQSKKNELYDRAMSLLGEQKPLADNTLKEINKQLKHVNAPSATNTSETGQGRVASALRAIKESWSKDGKAIEVDPNEMLAQIKALGEMQRTGNTRSYTKLLKPIQDAIEKDIAKAGNQEFIAEYNVAKDFYKNEIVPYIKTDIGRSLLNGEVPKAAYAMTGSAEGIKELKNMVAKQPNGEKLVDMLLRTKAQERILETSFKDGKFKTDNFINLFTQSKNDEYLFELLGKAYKPIKENILPIARAVKRVSVPNSAAVDNLATGVGVFQVLKGVATLDKSKIATGLGIHLLPKALANVMLQPKVAKRMVLAAQKDNNKVFTRILLNSLKNDLKALKDQPIVKYQGFKAANQWLQDTN